MDKNEKQLQEQDAPLKNTDNAFVQVSKDGTPSMPQTNTEKKFEDETENTATSPDR